MPRTTAHSSWEAHFNLSRNPVFADWQIQLINKVNSILAARYDSIISKTLIKSEILMFKFLRFKNTKSLGNNRAVAMLEFIIALPLFLIIFVVLFEAGRYFDVYFRLANIAWNGSRFFSSLSLPAVACFQENTQVPTSGNTSIYTTNLAAWAHGPNPKTQPSKAAVFDTHVLVHQRIRAMFWVASDTWPITSDELIPTPDGPGTQKLNEKPGEENVPTIKTQYIGALSNPDGSTPNSRLAQVCISPPLATVEDLHNENTVGVCLEAKYTGLFFDIPVKSCSYGFLLVNNESSIIPSNSNFINGNNGQGGGYTFPNGQPVGNGGGGGNG